MEKHISFDDLMKELRVTDPKRFRRRLVAYGFQVSNEYDKRTANEIADRFDIKIPWHKYKHEQVVPDESGPLTQGLPAAIVNKIEGWFGKLQNSSNTASVTHDHIIGMVCTGGFLYGGQGEEFLIGLDPRMNVVIGDRGSGKSTLLNSLGVLTGSLREETDVLVRKLLNLRESAQVDHQGLEQRIRRVMRDYGLDVLALFFRLGGNLNCLCVAHDRAWTYDLQTRQTDGSWLREQLGEALLNFPLQFLDQGEVTRIWESSDRFYLNKIIDSLSSDLYDQRKIFAQSLNKLCEQYFHYKRKSPNYNFRNVDDFISNRRDEMRRMRKQLENKTDRFDVIEKLEGWIKLYDRYSKEDRRSSLLSLLQDKKDAFLYNFTYGAIVGFLHSAGRKLSDIRSEYDQLIKDVGEEDANNTPQVMEEVDQFETTRGNEIKSIIENIAAQLNNQLDYLKRFVDCYRGIKVDWDEPVASLVKKYSEILEAKIALNTTQEHECQGTTRVLNQDGVEVKLYTADLKEKIAEWKKSVKSLERLDALYRRINAFRFADAGSQDFNSLRGLVSDYMGILNSCFERLDYFKEIARQSRDANDVLFDEIEIELKQGNTYRPFQALSFGQKCGIILKLILRTDDPRILILDQPEDHLDAYSIVRIIAPTIQKLAEQRQVIIATHNSTLVLALKPNKLTVLQPLGEKGGLRVQGSLEEPNVVKEMLDILEGREETFELKIDLYESFLKSINLIEDANIRLIESSFRRRPVDGSTNERTYFAVVADSDASLVNRTIHELHKIADIVGIRLEALPATSVVEVIDAVQKHSIDTIFINLKGRIRWDDLFGFLHDPFGDILLIPISDSIQELEKVVRSRGVLRERFKFMRKNFESFDVGHVFFEIDNYFLGRPYPFPLVYARRSVSTFETHQARLTAWKDVIESIVKYAVIILLANVRASPAYRFKPAIKWQANLTLGTWLKLLKELLGHCESDRNSLFIPELYELFAGSDGHETEYMRLLEQFKDDLRDPIIGHGVTLDEGAYALLEKKYEEPIQRLYDGCLFLSRYQLVSVASIRDIRESNPGKSIFDYQVRILMGPEVRFNLVSWESEKRLRVGRAYIRRRDGEVLEVHPLMSYQTCRTCMADRLFLLDNVEKLTAPGCAHPLIDPQVRVTLMSEYATQSN